jgi:hypothetical protein
VSPTTSSVALFGLNQVSWNLAKSSRVIFFTLASVPVEIRARVEVGAQRLQFFADWALVNLNTLKSTMEKSLDIYADLILHPAFPQKEFENVCKRSASPASNARR